MLFVDPANRTIAAIHAGWRGTVAEIGPKVIRRMVERFGTRAVDLEVAIGPAIGLCCYEVGPEVASQFQPTFRDRKDLHTRTHIDLAEANRRQLIDSGVQPNAIAIAAMCTFCGKDDFHSFRRDAELAGRLISAIRII
jgi:YfiH family protein